MRALGRADRRVYAETAIARTILVTPNVFFETEIAPKLCCRPPVDCESQIPFKDGLSM